ncbi:hypothetical protein [Methylobacterium gnaphalii]|uniref:Uncharacterized protein n=1 Tax=Methylobacterium gnaphalii TaxID=1010610 RepID=A0A512JKU9_9HYPH|nr:hypothetical protein [Methylobacterium gnaphalii]GEP10512.1 hypothetical protein MGN01_23570 [Methylobacterium gnaphalii]GJD69261.1 hypothetical protein MMMDOFMJ_2189 [Methylobacterium gnaphalii]GLS47924.1 hypothetical protein GCM10007885_07680 [Methylobacterium gnaphalii]
MNNVIRPTFGTRPKTDAPSPPAAEHRALRIFGQAAGYTVALIQDDDDRTGPALKVVVGPTTGNEVEAVAILPALPEGEADADVVGMAILRTLEVIEAAGHDPEIA